MTNKVPDILTNENLDENWKYIHGTLNSSEYACTNGEFLLVVTSNTGGFGVSNKSVKFYSLKQEEI